MFFIFHILRCHSCLSMHSKGRTGRRRKFKKNLADRGELGHCVNGPDYVLLLKWAKRNGIFFGNLRPAIFPQTGRGLMSYKKLGSGDLLISVPEDMLITKEIAQKSDIGEVLVKHNLESTLSSIQILCAFLMNQKYRGESSFWFPYINTLPRSFNTPAYFTEEELRALPTSFQEQCVLQARKISESYVELKHYLTNFSSELDKGFVEFCTHDEFRWAWFVVNTRSVFKPVHVKNTQLGNSASRQGDEYVLAPVLDLLNHTCEAEVKAGLNELNHKYEIHTLSAYNKYSQVFISYGPHNNRKLLLEYGFLLPQNLHNTVDFCLEMFYSIVAQNMAGISHKKREVIKSNQLEKDLCCTVQNGLSWSVLVLLRILAMSEDTFQKDRHKAWTAEALPEHVEFKVCQWGQRLIQDVLESYVTSPEEQADEMSKDGTLTVNMEIALLLKKQEKQILLDTLEMLHC